MHQIWYVTKRNDTKKTKINLKTSLAKIAFRKLDSKTWFLLDSHIQYCIFPYHQALIVLQRKIRYHVHRFKTKMDLFLSLLDGHRENERLRPKRGVKYPIFEIIARIAPGEHIAFRFRGIYHHGIVLERPDDHISWFVADFSSPSGDILMRDAELRRRSLHDFVNGVLEFWIIPYDEDNVFEREKTIQIANFMVEAQLHKRAPYHCLRNNCETFVVLCKTGNLDNGGSEQGYLICEAIRNDLNRKKNSFLMNVLGSSILYARRLLT